jgi:hypothetical protein
MMPLSAKMDQFSPMDSSLVLLGFLFVVAMTTKPELYHFAHKIWGLEDRDKDLVCPGFWHLIACPFLNPLFCQNGNGKKKGTGSALHSAHPLPVAVSLPFRQRLKRLREWGELVCLIHRKAVQLKVLVLLTWIIVGCQYVTIF